MHKKSKKCSGYDNSSASWWSTKNNQQPCLLTDRHHSICCVESVLVILPTAKNNRSRYKRTIPHFYKWPKDNRIEDEKQDRKTRNYNIYFIKI